MTRPDASSALGEDLVDELRLIVEAAPFAIVVSNQSGRVVLVNAEAERLFGRRASACWSTKSSRSCLKNTVDRTCGFEAST